MQDILGLNPIVLSILIIIAGVGLHTTLGWLQSSLPPNARKVAASVIIGCFASFGIVTPVIHELLIASTSSYIQFVAIITAIATIAGIDQLVKNAGSAILRRVKSK